MQAKVEREREKSLANWSRLNRSLPDVGTWRERMLTLPASQRKCRYTLTGHVDNKVCPNSYECGNCSYDQMMQERWNRWSCPPQQVKEVGGIKVLDGFYYHEGHTWARPEHAGRVRVGLDDFARRLLGSLSRFRCPRWEKSWFREKTPLK